MAIHRGIVTGSPYGIKCAGKQHTKQCKKPQGTNPKCIHCGEEHPANYRGCTIVRKVQNMKN